MYGSRSGVASGEQKERPQTLKISKRMKKAHDSASSQLR